MRSFTGDVLKDGQFCRELEALVERVCAPGRVNSLAQTLVKCTSPGVPDLYQGSELWDLSLVDPDNRRPVDYALRRTLLDEMRSMRVAEVLARWDDGLPKLWTLTRALHLRKEMPASFGVDAGYVPMEVTGSRRDSVIAFLRGDSVATVVPRLTLGLQKQDWGDTAIPLPSGNWRNRLTDEVVSSEKQVLVTEMLTEFPVALLVKEEKGNA